MPKEMAHSHLGMVTDGRYIYIVTGQYGPQCRGPTPHTFVLDTKTKKWHQMPPLPLPRYISNLKTSSHLPIILIHSFLFSGMPQQLNFGEADYM